MGSVLGIKGGLIPMMQGGSFVTKKGGIMEVATWLCAPLSIGLSSSLGIVANYDVLVLGKYGSLQP